MTEYEADSGIVSLENGKDVLSSIPKGGVYLVELVAHDFAVWADIVDIDFDCVAAGLADAVTCKFWIESHVE